ncbi:MAG: N-acetylglucosamine-6-phosphate deacetylase [Paracoccaceae bacterium]
MTFYGGQVFDGTDLIHGLAARWNKNRFVGLVPANAVPPDDEVVDLKGAILSPGYVDLQVNGGGGLFLNDDPSTATLTRIAAAHRALGAVRVLPTLITDTKETTQAALQAASDAVRDEVQGIAGLHLEGPHLATSRKGAHDGTLIRPMTDADADMLCAAKEQLPVLKVTLAPESVTLAQVKRLLEAGVLVALGHSDARFETAMAYADAGVQCVTHLFNAMSPVAHRAPGLAGAALAHGGLSVGLIADGVHVHPAVMQMAWRAKNGPGHIYLVSDAMAVAGTDAIACHLGGRHILRRDGRLTLEDGTLAGADLDLTRAIAVLTGEVGVPLVEALRAATCVPADVIGLSWGLIPGNTHLSDMIVIQPDLSSATPASDLNAG